MPISGRFTKATEQKIKNEVPTKSGVYELKSFGNHVYTGKASNLRRRLLEHYRKKDPNGFRYETVGFFGSAKRLEDEHLTKYEKRHGKLPPWNSNDTRS